MVSLDDAVLARMEKGGKRYELLVDPNEEDEFKSDPQSIDLNQFLAMDEVFHDIRGGERPTAEAIENTFGTQDILEIAKTKSNLTGDSKNRILGQIHQNLGIILHRENARALLRRCAFMQGQLPTEVLSSAALLQGAVTDEHGF